MNTDAVMNKRLGVAAGLMEGSLSVPLLFLKCYRLLNMSELEAMLVVHLMAFQDKDGKEFPTIEEIQSRMSASPEELVRSLHRLLTEGLIAIDEYVDSVSGVRSEKYSIVPLYDKIAACWDREGGEMFGSESEPSSRADSANRLVRGSHGESGNKQSSHANSANRLARGSDSESSGTQSVRSSDPDIFTIFENEFARPLSPMECETISAWLDQDKYSFELIIAALKEAVFAGKVHFRYIDRILLEWSRNRVFTEAQAKEYTQKFRGMR